MTRLDTVLPLVREDLALRPGPIDVPRVARVLSGAGMVAGPRALVELADQVRTHLTGLGPLQSAVDAEVTDLLVNPDGAVWVERIGAPGLARVDDLRLDPGQCRDLAVRLAAAAGQRLDDAVPFADGRLPGGARLHGVLEPVARGGACISLRFPHTRALTLDDLARAGTLPAPLDQVVSAVVDRRLAFLVSGGTGSGKTTLLQAMLTAVDGAQRIVVVEDSPELDPRHPHCVRLAGRRANVEGAGEVHLADLVRQCLRMRPDRIVVGECRGPELRELLQALNTGHEGGCGTVHANDPTDVPARLEALGALAGMSREAVATQAASALDLVLHLRRDAAAGRLLTDVALLERGADGTLATRSALTLDAAGACVQGPGWPELARRLDGRPR